MEHYHHLTDVQRYYLEISLQAGMSKREIAAALKVSLSTIYREIERNGDASGYSSARAGEKAILRSKIPRRPQILSSDLLVDVVNALEHHYSPEQISGRLKMAGMFVSHTTIYAMIAMDKRNGGFLWKFRRRHKKYRRRNIKETRGCIPNRTMISERPDEINLRQRFGDWEGDTVIGEQGSLAIVTLTERKTGYEVAFKVKSRTSDVVAAEIIKRMRRLKLPVLSITFDNGHEFSQHQRISKFLDCQVFFALPHHPWERGTNENTNGLLREFFPKGTNLNEVSQQQIRLAAENLNNRPRKRLNYLTPKEAVEFNLAAARLNHPIGPDQLKQSQITIKSKVLHL